MRRRTDYELVRDTSVGDDSEVCESPLYRLTVFYPTLQNPALRQTADDSICGVVGQTFEGTGASLWDPEQIGMEPRPNGSLCMVRHLEFVLDTERAARAVRERLRRRFGQAIRMQVRKF